MIAISMPCWDGTMARNHQGMLTANYSYRNVWDLDEGKDHDATPKGLHDQWKLTPSIMDPNSFAFSSFANQPPGYYTPTPGGVNTLYHSQAGDLHTPGMGMTIGTPLSLPQSASTLPSVNLNTPMQAFQQLRGLSAHRYDNPGYVPSPQTFAPSSFLHHQDSGYGAPSQSPLSPHVKTDPRMPPPDQASIMMPRLDSGVASASGFREKCVLSNDEWMAQTDRFSFRYHATLNAPTAMIKHADEIPISYLNKGQAYTLNITDTRFGSHEVSTARYRTFVRVSFEDEEQRQKPGACWQLWKEGRGTNEAHHRDGKLLAVEYVDTNQGGDEETRRQQVELQQNSFDGFYVNWCPNPFSGRSECAISVRFNFLSTDFSHSKGVKGIPVRLCAKTEKLSPTSSMNPTDNEPEVCYAKVKLFRDHGAERKLANDIAHVKKQIEKLKQSISQVEAGLPSFNKRKRSSSISKPLAKGPGKTIKHKRTWSMESDGEGLQSTPEEDLVMKLNTTQDMFSSTRPVSVLFLRGDPEDDPDLFPVRLPAESQDVVPMVRTETWESKASTASTPVTSAISPTSSSNAIVSPRLAAIALQAPSDFATRRSIDAQLSRSSQSTSRTHSMAQQTAGASGKMINVVGIDHAYQAPPERLVKPGKFPLSYYSQVLTFVPVACFYVRHRDSREPYHRAVYIMQRTVKDLVHSISHKFGVEASTVLRVTHINQKGLQIVVDEDVVRELPEGQDMIVEFSPANQDFHLKAELPEAIDTQAMVDGDLGSIHPHDHDGLEMWLNF